jgi:hypothetical protein
MNSLSCYVRLHRHRLQTSPAFIWGRFHLGSRCATTIGQSSNAHTIRTNALVFSRSHSLKSSRQAGERVGADWTLGHSALRTLILPLDLFIIILIT